MKIAFNPSTVAALTTPPNNKDITFDLRGRNIFARGVKFCGTDTNTWRDIKINNVSIGSNILDLRNGSNTTLTNTNGVVTINSTWRPVVDNLTSDSTTSSLSAKQGKVLKSLIDGKSNSGHTHDDRYLKLTGGTMTGNIILSPNTEIIKPLRSTSNYDTVVSWSVDGETKKYGREIGSHNTGGNDSTGSIAIVPYKTDTAPWLGTVGLFIAKNTLKLDGKPIAFKSDIPSSLKSPYSLTLKANGTTLAIYNGSSDKEANFTYANIGAASASHTHSNYVTDLGTSGNYLTWVKNGSINNITVPYATGSSKLMYHSLIGYRTDFDSFTGENVIKVALFQNKGTDDEKLVPPFPDGSLISFPWGNDNKYGAQLAVEDGGQTNHLAIRNKSNSNTWGAWAMILTSANYNLYSPKLDGTGASGTWDINITGNANTVDGVHVTWYGALTSTSHLVAWEADGSALRDINPAHVTVGNSDKVDGFHATSGNNKPWGTIPAITTNGYMDIGKHLEFHYDNTTGSDYSTALMCQGNYSNIVYLPSESGTLALTSQVLTWRSQIIDMRNYDESYWHPVTVPLPYTGYNKIKVSVQLNIYDKPSWATHNAGFTCNMEIWATASGWGTTSAETICLNYTYAYCNSNPCGWMQLGYQSLGVLFLRGGSRYKVYTDFNATFTPHDKTYTWTDGEYTQSTGGPYTSCPGLNFNKNRIYANLNGTAENADKLDNYHASDLLTALSNSNNGVSITVGGTTKSISNISVNYANSAGNADTLDGIDSTRFLRQVVVPNNTENDFNTFSNMTLTGRVDPTTGASLKNAPWSGSGPAGGYGVLTYLFNGWDYGTQMAWEYGSNRIYIRNRHWGGSGVGTVWRTSWDTLALTSDNVASATKLQTPRLLWGQSFDGTRDISGSIRGTYFHIEDRASNPYFKFIDSSNQIGYFQLLPQNKGVAIGSTESKSLIVNPSGNVGIGTTNLSYKLSVGGDIGTEGNIYISHNTNNNMNYNTSNPRIVFSENGNQAVGLVYTDYDSYRTSKGLKVMDVDNNDTSNVWLEVQGYNYSSGYVKNGSNSSYVLLGDGGHKLESALNVSNADLLDGQHGSRYTRALGSPNYITINVGGDANTYYPVVISSVSDYYPMQFVNISRVFNETAPNTWNTSTHKGGLTLTLLWNGSRFWDGNSSGYACYCVYKNESYSTMVGGLGNATGGKVVWLRGGGAAYHIHSMNGTSTSVTVYTSTYTDGANRSFSPRTTPEVISVRWPGMAQGADYATSASNADTATKVIVNQHTTNDTNYPLVWSNQSNTNSVTENQLYKSWSDLYYNPKNKRLTVGGSVVASSFVKRGGTSQQLLRADGGIAAFNWSGQSGQPSWLWGGNNEHSYYVYNPSNFRVAYATSAGSADTAQYLRSLGNQNCQTGRTQNYGDVYSYNTYANNTGAPTDYTSVIGFGRGIAGTVEIAGGWDNTNLYWRSLRDCCEDWHSWRTVLDSSNYTEYINNYYWANVKISTSSSTTTSPTVSNLTATNSIRMGNIYLQNTNEINSTSGIHLNYQNSGNISLCYGGGNVGIGTTSPAYKLDVNGQMRASGFHHSSMNSDNYILLAGGGYKSFGGDSSHPVFLGYLNLDHGSDGTVSSSFSCLGYTVPFTYTRGGNYCKISIPDTTHQAFYIKAATASVNYSGGGMDTWTGNHRGAGAWWLHCYAPSSNEVRVKGFHLKDTNNDSWWGGNPLWSDRSGVNRITVCIFGYVTFR